MRRFGVSRSIVGSEADSRDTDGRRRGNFPARLCIFLLTQVALIAACLFLVRRLLPPAACKCGAGGSTFVPKRFETCELEQVGGRKKDRYGWWPLCSNQVPPNATIYSFGIGLDASFDIEMIGRGAQIFAFDPTITPENATALLGPKRAELGPKFHFMQVGLGATNGVVRFLRPADRRIQSMTSLESGTIDNFQYLDVGFQAAVLTLPTIMAALQHDHVDLLKVDVEGAEFGVCESGDFLAALDRVQQVAYEFHERLLKDVAGRLEKCVGLLSSRGFTEVYRNKNREEFVFARMKPGGKVTNRLPAGKS